MLKLDAQFFIPTLAESMLGDEFNTYVAQGFPKKAVKIELDCSASHKNRRAREIVYIIITQSHEVFYCTKDFAPVVFPKPEDYQFYSAHDSCWRNLDFLSTIYFDLCEKVNPKVAPVNINFLVVPDGEFRVVTVTTQKDPNCSINYKRTLTSIAY